MRDLLNLCLGNAVVVVFLAVPAYCVSRWGRRPALAHVLWLFVLIKLVTPPLWRVPVSLPVSQSALSTSTDSANVAIENPTPAMEIIAGQSLPDLPFFFDQTFDPALSPENAITTTPAAPAPLDTTILSAAATDVPFEFSWQATLGFCWLAGSCVVFGLTLWRLAAFARCLRRVQPAVPSMQALTEELSQNLGLRSTPRVGIAPIRMAPLVWGFGNQPRVIVPAALWQTLDPEQRAMLLVHELAHLRRGDHWVRWLELLVRGVYWWHPVVWLAGREMREAEEQCCDAWAVWALPHAAKAYARALVDTVDFLSQRSVPLPVGASGIGQFQDLQRRLIMIMRGTTPRKLSAATMASLIVLGGSLVVMGPSFGQQDPPPAARGGDDIVPSPAVPAAPRRVQAPTKETVDPTRASDVARLKQQEASLRQAMDALARSLDQTRKELKSMGAQPQEDGSIRPTAPARGRQPLAPPTPMRPPADFVRPSPDQILPRMNAARQPADPVRPRMVREGPIEDRLSRLEEQMSQIAHDLHALRGNLAVPREDVPTPLAPPAPPPTQRPRFRPGQAPPAGAAVPLDGGDLVAPPVAVRPAPRPPVPADLDLPALPGNPEGPVPPVPPAPTRPRRPSAPGNTAPGARPAAPVPPTPPGDPFGAPVPTPPAVKPPAAFVVTPEMIEQYVAKDAEVKGFQNEIGRANEYMAKLKVIVPKPEDLPEYREYVSIVNELKEKIERRKDAVRPQVRQRLDQIAARQLDKP